MKTFLPFPPVFLLSALLAGCGTTSLDNTPGRLSAYRDHADPAHNLGVGIESHDIAAMADIMVRDILSVPRVAARSPAARLILDTRAFRNEGSQPINLNLIVDEIRTELLRAARGRLIILARHAPMKWDDEPRTADAAASDAGAKPKVLPADYRLLGAIKSLDAINPRTGRRERFNHITFELVDMETQELVWANSYRFKKAAETDILYR